MHGKKKYMHTGTGGDEALIVTVQRVIEFTYMASPVAQINDVSSEIRKMLVAENRAYFALLKTTRSTSITGDTKLVIYKAHIRPVLTYASQIWTISRNDENSLLIFERKLLRRTVDPVKEMDRRTGSFMTITYPDTGTWTLSSLKNWGGTIMLAR